MCLHRSRFPHAKQRHDIVPPNSTLPSRRLVVRLHLPRCNVATPTPWSPLTIQRPQRSKGDADMDSLFRVFLVLALADRQARETLKRHYPVFSRVVPHFGRYCHGFGNSCIVCEDAIGYAPSSSRVDQCYCNYSRCDRRLYMGGYFSLVWSTTSPDDLGLYLHL